MGLKVPPLGSIQDKILRAYLLRRAQKEVHKNKILAQYATSASASNSGASKELNSIWEDYVSMEFFQEEAKEDYHQSLMDEYVKWVDVRPVLHKGKDGKVTVSGIPKGLA